MGKSKAASPPQLDPTKLAAQQAATNRDTAIAQTRLNQVDEVTPFGTSTYAPTGEKVDGIQQYKRTTTLNPEDQKMLDVQRQIGQQLLGTGSGLLDRVNESTSNPFSLGDYPAITGINEDARQGVEDALYKRATNRLDRRFGNQQTDLETQLANQGFARGSEAWKREMQDFSENRDDAYEQARLGAEASAIQEQGRLFGLESSQRERAIQEGLLERGLPLQEIQGLLGTSPGITTPQFSPTPQTGIAGTDVLGANTLAFNSAQNRGGNNSFMNGVFGVAKAALPFVL